MSKDNGDNATGAMILGGLAALAMVAFFMIAFVAFVATIVAFTAWNTPRRFGKHVIQPEEARAFVKRGAGGAILLPSFLGLCEIFMGITINWDYLPEIVVAGYCLGSLGLEYMLANDDTPPEVTIRQPPARVADQRRLPSSQPHRFASWDDDEEHGR